jgi:hypothetical protein
VFSKPVTELIRARTSVRTYAARPLDAADEKRLRDFLGGLPSGPFGTRPRFKLIAAREGDEDALRGLGTYGMIRHAAGFVVGAMDRTGGRPEDFGYLMEMIILKATELGLESCWLGGTFRKSRFAAAIGAGEGETVPAVISVGTPVETRGLRDRIIRTAAGSDKRLPWDRLYFSGAFDAPLSREAAGAYEVPLEMVRLAPSASNKQPWRIVKDPAAPLFHFFLARTKGYDRGEGRGPKSTDLQRVDLGIAMCHFELAAAEKGLLGAWETGGPGLSPPPAKTEPVAIWRGR